MYMCIYIALIQDSVGSMFAWHAWSSGFDPQRLINEG